MGQILSQHSEGANTANTVFTSRTVRQYFSVVSTHFPPQHAVLHYRSPRRLILPQKSPWMLTRWYFLLQLSWSQVPSWGVFPHADAAPHQPSPKIKPRMVEVSHQQFLYSQSRDLLVAPVPFPHSSYGKRISAPAPSCLHFPIHPSPPFVYFLAPRSHKAAVHPSPSLPKRSFLVPLSLSPERKT